MLSNIRLLGLMTAYMLRLEKFTNITIVADAVENLTSHSAGGLWAPSFASHDKTPAEEAKYRKILKVSHAFYTSVISDTNHPFHEAVSYVPLYAGSKMPFEEEVNGFYNGPEDVIVTFGDSVEHKMKKYSDAIFIQVLKCMELLSKFSFRQLTNLIVFG